MSEATIDELRIEVEAEAQQATDNLEKLIKQVEKLKSAVTEITEKSGINTLKKQISKLTEAVQSAQNTSGVEKITQLVDAIKGLNKLDGVNSEGINATISMINKLQKTVSRLNAMQSVDMQWIQQLADSVRPFENANTQGFADFLRSLRNLPSVSERLGAMDFERFTCQMEQFAAAIEPAAQQLGSISEALGGLPDNVTEYIGALGNIPPAANRANTSTSGLSTTLGNLKVKTAAAIAAIRTLVDRLSDCVNTSNQFVENLNLFSVTMGESAAEAYEFAEAVNEALGIDTSDWARYQGFFQSIGKGFGIVTEKADLMSQNLTQLSYDISSFYNTSVDEAYNKVVSGISGELEPLRRYGFALDEATLKQVAYEHGITQSVEAMTQAQKAQLRYVAILEQAGNIGILGDMSRTIDNSANQLRILEARLEQFARAIGNMVMPILSEILPYLTAFIQLLTEGAQAIANFLGFELPKIDLNTTSVTNGYDDITAATEAATEATEAFKGSLAGVDQLNIIGSTNDNAGDTTGLDFDLDIDLPTYDFLNGVESRTKEIFEGMKQIAQEVIPYLETVLTLVGGIWGTAKLSSLWTSFAKGKGVLASLKTLFTGGATGIVKFGSVLTGGIASMTLWKNAAKQMALQTDNAGTSLGVAIAGTVALGVAATAIAGPVGLLAVGIGGLAGFAIGCSESMKEINEAIADNILYRNSGTKITEVADAFSKWADAAADVNQQTINKYKQLEEYSTAIENLRDSFDGLNPAVLTAEDASALQEPFAELVDYLNNEFQERCSLAAESVREAFTNLGIGAAIGEEVELAYKQLQTTLNQNLTESQKVVEKYLGIVSAGGELTQSQEDEFLSNYNYTLEVARLDNATYQDVQNALADLQQLDLSDINLVDDDTVKTAVEQMKTSFTNYVDNAREAYDLELDNIAELRRRVELDFSYGKISSEDYQSNLDLLSVSERAARLNYNDSIAKIEEQVTPILESVIDKYLKTSMQLQHGAADWALSGFDDLQAQINVGMDWLNSNDDFKDFADFYMQVQETQLLEIDTVYNPDSAFAEFWDIIAAKNDIQLSANVTADIDEDIISFVDIAKEGAIGITANIAFDIDNPMDRLSQIQTEMLSAVTTTIPINFGVGFVYRNSDFDFEAEQEEINNALDKYTAKTTSSSTGSARGEWWNKVGYSSNDSGNKVTGSLENLFSGFFADYSDIFASKDSEDRPLNITLHSTVEMDGDAVGEAVAQYNDRQAYVTNGGRSR